MENSLELTDGILVTAQENKEVVNHVPRGNGAKSMARALGSKILQL